MKKKKSLIKRCRNSRSCNNCLFRNETEWGTICNLGDKGFKRFFHKGYKLTLEKI